MYTPCMTTDTEKERVYYVFIIINHGNGQKLSGGYVEMHSGEFHEKRNPHWEMGFLPSQLLIGILHIEINSQEIKVTFFRSRRKKLFIFSISFIKKLFEYC